MDKLANANYSSSATKLKYELTTAHVDDSDDLSYTTYGIVAWDEDGNRLVAYPDISTSREYVRRFLDLLEARDVAAIHIGDLLEDYLD